MLITGELLAQERTISGKVTSSEDGSPLPGVNVVIKGTTSGTVTDIDGNYRVSTTQGDGTLVFTFIGLQTLEVEMGSRSTIDVQMSSDIRQLNEVVVTGYGERERNSFTGAFSNVGAEAIQNKPFATVEQALQGNVAGLQLAASSGTPGAVQNIRIRGVSSLTASNEPLFVIDGVPVISGSNNRDVINETGTADLGVLASINNNDIESITVLKDASATALYGARGSNGVIIITTKRGQAGTPTLSFSAQTGFVSRAVKGPKMLNSAQWQELQYESLINAGYAADLDEAAALVADPSNGLPQWNGQTNTDWRDVVANDDAMTHNYDLSMRGGSDKSNYYASLGYFKQDGINIGSNMERITGKLNYNNQLSKKLNFNTSLTGSYLLQNGQLEGSAYYGNPDAAYLFMLPIDRAYNDDGTPNIDNLSTSNFNPVFIAQNDINRRIQSRILNNTSLSYEILPKLKYTTMIGVDYVVTEELYYRNREHGDGVPTQGRSDSYYNRNFNWDWKNMLDYSWKVNESNKFDFKFVYESQKNRYFTMGAGGYGFAANGLVYPETAGTPDNVSSYTTDWSINSIMALVNYTYKGNIFLDATVRREGNSRFAEGNRWGTFYSFGASWVFSDEAFMESTKNWLTSSKIRASYGVTGNAGIPLNAFQPLLDYTGSYNGRPGIYPSQYGNPDLSWESSATWNIGLDVELLERITGTVEYFNRRNYDLLLEVPLSYTTGFENQYQNIGEMVNKGWEVTLNADVLKAAEFKWNIGVNFTSLKNEVTDLPKDANGNEIGPSGTTYKVSTGQPAFAWYMPTWAGVDSDTGSPLWFVQGKSGELTSNWRQAGYSFQGTPTPTFFGGLTNRFDYKGAYLSASIYYSTGNEVYDTWAGYTQSDGRYAFNGVANAYARQYDRWQKPGDISENPKNVFGNPSLSANASTRRLYDGTYLRLRDITVGYNLPSAWVSKIGFKSLDVYVRGNNLYTWIKDSKLEFDPEVDADGFIDLNAPALRTLAIGLRGSF